jgi:hypothetical protein
MMPQCCSIPPVSPVALDYYLRCPSVMFTWDKKVLMARPPAINASISSSPICCYAYSRTIPEEVRLAAKFKLYRP